MKKCFTFAIISNYKNTNFYVDNHLADPNTFYFVGIEGDDESLVLKNENNIVSVLNNRLGSVPVFIFSNEEKWIVTNSLYSLTNEVSLEISEELFLDYFLFNYIPGSNLCLYKDLKSLEPGSQISINLSTNIFEIKDRKTDLFLNCYAQKELNILQSFKENLRKKVKNISDESLAVCLSSGEDSLLSGLVFSKIKPTCKAATYGQENSRDIIQGDKRSIYFFNKRSLKYSKSTKFTSKELKSFAIKTAGLTSFTNIYLDLFFKNIKKQGVEWFVFSDHFEVFRKELKTTGIIQKYMLPEEVVEKYLIKSKKEDFLKAKKRSTERINAYYEGFDKAFSFYFYDRVIKGHFYKTLLANENKVNKITLPFSCKLLSDNHSLAINKISSYTTIFDHFADSKDQIFLENEKLYYHKNKEEKKSFPIDPNKFLYSNKSFFTNQIKTYNQFEKNNIISKYFNLNKLLKDLETQTIPSGCVWFTTRILCCIVFLNCNR